MRLDADGGGDEVYHFLFDQGGVHVEDDEAGVPSERTVGLEDDVNIPFALEAVEKLMFAEVGECQVGGVGCRREGYLHDAGMAGVVEAAVGRGERNGPRGQGKGGQEMQKRGYAQGRHIGAVEMVERFWIWWGRL